MTTVVAMLLVAAGTQVVPTLSLPAVPTVDLTSVMPGVPFDARIEVSLERVAETVVDAAPDRAEVYQHILDQGRKLLHFDPEANLGRGSWTELIGSIDEHTETVGVLVPGSAAFILDDNFDKYHQRAVDLVEASGGSLAMVVWAAGTFPKGWLQGALTHYQVPLGRSLAAFSHELRAEIRRELGPGTDVRIVVAGHSFGGAVVGSAERHGLDADAVLHIASAGMAQVRDPYDYPDPSRPRYAMTGPGDLISLVQGLPSPPGLGHGPRPETFRCVVTLPTGRLPDNPTLPDELGEPLGDRAGEPIGGVSSHSEVFIQYSDAWWRIYDVFTGVAPQPGDCPPPAEPQPFQARVLPLAVPRVVTVSQCRTGGRLRSSPTG